MSTEDISPTKVLWGLVSIVSAIMLALGGWLCQRSIAHDAQIAAVQYQIQAMIQTQTNVIPPVVEGSLKEIREKGNALSESISRITEIAGRNAQDIGYLKEQIAKKAQ